MKLQINAKKIMDDFVVFILSHGRADNVKTFHSLKKCGYTGKIFVLIDNEDPQVDLYKENFKDKLIIYDKEKVAGCFEIGDNFNKQKGVVFAREACTQMAKKMGLRYFMQLDDDYTDWEYRFNSDHVYHWNQIKNLDSVFAAMLKFMKKSRASAVCLSQGGDFIGGSQSGFARSIQLKRKAMNTFILDADNAVTFIGRFNEDVNTYSLEGSRGRLFFTTSQASIKQVATQQTDSGMTDLYLTYGTYIKSFYSVMFCPSFAKVAIMYAKNSRIHHRINWNNACPKILDESHKKKLTKR